MVAAQKGGLMVTEQKSPNTRTESMNSFRSALSTFLLRWRLGLLFAGVLRAAVWWGAALLVLGVLDYHSGFSDAARQYVFGALVALAAGGSIWAIIDAISFMRRDAA